MSKFKGFAIKANQITANQFLVEARQFLRKGKMHVHHTGQYMNEGRADEAQHFHRIAQHYVKGAAHDLSARELGNKYARQSRALYEIAKILARLHSEWEKNPGRSRRMAITRQWLRIENALDNIFMQLG